MEKNIKYFNSDEEFVGFCIVPNIVERKFRNNKGELTIVKDVDFTDEYESALLDGTRFVIKDVNSKIAKNKFIEWKGIKKDVENIDPYNPVTSKHNNSSLSKDTAETVGNKQPARKQMTKEEEKSFLKFMGGMVGFAILICLVGNICSEWDTIQRKYERYNKENLEEKIYAASSKGNYENAHDFLAELKAMDSRYDSTFEECLERVITEESSYLISLGDEQSAKRVIFLLIQKVEDKGERKKIAKKLLLLSETADNKYMVDLLNNLLKTMEEEK